MLISGFQPLGVFKLWQTKEKSAEQPRATGMLYLSILLICRWAVASTLNLRSHYIGTARLFFLDCLEWAS
jgi:hypothetical protein